MAYSPAKIYRFLKFKDGFVSGRVLARHMNIPLRQLEKAGESPGVGSMGPVNEAGTKSRSAKFWQTFAASNLFCADFICFFRSSGTYRCLKDRPLRKGANRPNRRPYAR